MHSSESPIRKRNADGNMTIHGATDTTGLASERIAPSVGIVTGTPQPRNEREASESIEEENIETDCNAIIGNTSGIMCLRKTYGHLRPRPNEAST